LLPFTKVSACASVSWEQKGLSQMWSWAIYCGPLAHSCLEDKNHNLPSPKMTLLYDKALVIIHKQPHVLILETSMLLFVWLCTCVWGRHICQCRPVMDQCMHTCYHIEPGSHQQVKLALILVFVLLWACHLALYKGPCWHCIPQAKDRSQTCHHRSYHVIEMG
jgi:hypothetical protein